MRFLSGLFHSVYFWNILLWHITFKSQSSKMSKIKEPCPGVLDIYTRQMWDALPPRDAKEHSDLYRVVRLTSAGPATCSNHYECANIIQHIQMDQIDILNVSDLNYNWLVGGDGRVYEGRGWWTCATEQVAHDDRGIPLDIGIVGEFTKSERLPKVLSETIRHLIEYGKNNDLIAEDHMEIKDWSS